MRTFRHTQRLCGALAAAILLGDVAVAAPPQKTDAAREYEACTQLAKQSPEQALAAATYWSGKGGGLLAAQCKGLALMALQQFDAAAQEFAALATQKKTPLAPATRARLFSQAAQASLGARQPEKARDFLGQSIALKPDVTGFRIDRSITASLLNDFKGALEDLNAILAQDPAHIEALTFRANAYREMNRIDDAAADIENVLLIQPDRPEALLERGVIRAIQGNLDAARQDWEKIIRIVPDSTTARVAQDNLRQLQQMP